MPKQKAPRPTKTNTGDYLLDFEGTDFSQFGGQQAQQQEEEPGLMSKIGSSAQAIAEGATMLPGQIADTLRDAYHGGDVDVTDTDAIRARQAREQERADYGKKYDGKAFEGVTDAMNSMGYSMGTMGASLGAAALASPAGPVAAGAAGMAASGAMAYRATKQQFLQQMLGETEKVLGRLPTQDEWDKIATEFDGEATRYGAWEAGPEALSNLFMAKILGPLGKGLLRGSVGQGIKRIGGLYGEELATETATQMGQGQEEANVGLRDTAPGVWDAFKEIGPATFWQTTLMAGGKKGADMLANRMRVRSQQVENNVDQTQQQGQETTGRTNQAALPMAQGIFALPQGDGSIPMGSTDTGRGPIAAGVVAGQQPKPFLSDADHADTEAFVRAFEERERNRDDEESLIEYGQRQARSPAQLALDQGENVDLLSLPQGNAAMAMGTEETGRAPIAPPTDYAGQPIATPYTPRPALPEQTSQSAGIGQWAGGRSQLAYGPKSEPQMMQGLGIMPQQSAPVQPQAMPTSAQISNTQAAPRSDTTAAANALGMSAPQAVPQEAMAPQRVQALPTIMQGIGAAPAQPAPVPQQALTRQPQAEQNSRGPWLEVVHIGDSAPKAKPRPQQSQSAGRADDSRPIGKNSRGQQVFEDKNGVRSYADGGVRVSQSVGVIPGHGISFDGPDALYKSGKQEYLTNDEVKKLSGSTGEPESKKPSRLELIRQLPKEEQADARKLPNSKLMERVRQLSQVNTASEDQPGVVESNHAKEDEHAEANEGRTSRNEGKAESGVRNPDEASGNATDGSHEEVHAEPGEGMADGRRAEGASGLHSGTGSERGKHAGRYGEEADRQGNERGRSMADGARSGDAGLLAGSGAGPRGVKDYRISPDDHIGEGGKVAKFNDNLSAIRTLKEIEQSGRPATEDEQKALARYVGWGGMPEMFAKGGKADPSLARRRTELRELLSPKEFEEARRSTTNAHYTSPQIITAMWDAIKRMGFKGGKVLEPSMGVGNFIGLMPDDVYKKSNVTGIELDGITARIAKMLYPQQTILSQGFETAKLRDGSFDLAISNVPFGDYKLHDTRYAKHNLFIHDYFITRALDLVRPGGVVAFITTTGSLNSGRSMNMRQLAADKARLLGAIRLPGTSFAKNALTEVTTDILFLQRLGEGHTNTGPVWKDVVDTDVVSEKTGKPLRNNEYYSSHPEMMLGQLADDKLYPGRTALKDDGRDMPAALGDALKTLPEGVFSGEGLRHEDQKATANVQMQDAKEGQLLLDGEGNIVQVSDGELKPYAADGKKAARIAGMIGVRDALRSNLRAQMNGDEDSIAHSRTALNDAYDAFVRQHGFLNDNANRLAMSEDPDFPLLQALENNYTKGKNGAQSKAEKADIFTRRTIAEPKIIEHAETPQDALHAQLADIGRVDIPGIVKMTGLSEQAVIDDLHGTIFQNPKGNQWETADDYLSGNVRTKLSEAKKAAEKDEKFKENVKALEAVQPQDVPPQDIRVDLGAGWVPSARVEEFAAKVLGISPSDVSARYSKELAQWSLNVKKSGLSNEYGTPERSALELLNDSLNLKQAKIQIDTPEGVIVNKEATIAAREAQRKLREEFSRWILEDEKRAGELARIYNDTYNAMRLYEADGSHLVLPGIADTIEGKPFALRPHQKSAVWRIIQKGNTLVAHAVGAGKTYEMIAAGMEMKRLGMINKPLYVVPNHMLEQWSREFLQAYPAANILVASKADLQKEKRRKFVSRIATGNWDAVVMTHSSYGRIPISVERKEKHIRDQIEQYESALRAENEEKKAGRGRSENRLVKQLEKQKMRLEEKLRTLLEDGKNAKDNQVNFEELGVDFMFVDEGHNFKNLSYVTRMQRIAGLPNSHSQRAEDMLLKTQYLDELHPGRSLVFATGTPISNTVAEMYTMTRYVAPHLLRESGLEMFDSWARQFGRTVTGMEISPDGRNFRENTRFSRFTNVPELLTVFRSFADVKTKEDLDLPLPDLKGGKPEVVSVKPSETLTNYVDELVARAERIRGGSVDPRKDNMLKVTSEGRLAALDMRLIDDTLPADPNGKVARATDNIYDIWKATSKDRLAQMVFCDLSVPSKQKATGLKEAENQDQDGETAKPEASPDDLLAAASRGSFSVYDEIKKNLVDMGVPADEIAFIHDFNGDKAKAQLFKDVRAGKVRVLLGSTAKMGEGTNVQERLVALHHLDAPWKPSAVEQREGRILRQGNKNSEVQIYTYVTENSFDAYMWQLLESKARFVATSMRSGVTERDMDDISVTELSAAEAKAAATGDKRILEKVGLDNTISRLTVLKREFDRNQWAKGREVAESKSRLATLTGILAAEKKDSSLAATLTGKNFALTLRGKEYTKSTDAAAAIIGIVSDKSIPSGAVIGKAGGFDITMWRKATGYEFSLSGESSFSTGDTTSSEGAVTRIVKGASPENSASRIAATEEAIAKTNRRLEGATKWLANNKSFDRQEELDSALARSQELDDELGLSASKDASVISNEADSDNDLMASRVNPGEYLPPVDGKKGMRLEDVQAVADKIGKVAKNAATSRVVQSFDELPYSIRERYSDAKNSVEGVFDPRSSVVWMVADNLSDPTRAAEVWAHEQIVHHGLRGLLPADARKRVLNQLWLGAGGMKNAMVKDISSRYGLAPTRSLQDRQTVMEEVIAALAEKKGQGLLERAEGNLWRRVVAALGRAWNSIVRAVSGRDGSMKLNNIDALLSALGRHVIDGESSGITQKAGPFEQAAAPASMSNEGDGVELASLSLKDILGLTGMQAAKIANAPEIRHMFKKDDLSLMQSILNLPHWIAKKVPAFAKLYKRQLQRLDERASALKESLESAPSIFGKDRLKPADMDSLKKLLWEHEGRDAWQIDASGVDKFVTKETLVNGRELISVNPEFYREYKKWLGGLEGTKAAKDAMLEIRKSLDEDLVRAHNRMAAMSEMSDDAIREFRQSIGHVPNYFPHHRYGNYFIQAKIGDEVVFRQHFDALNTAAAKQRAAMIAAEQKENYPDASWTDGKNDRLPDEILGAPIDTEAMEQIIRAATSKIADKERAAEINELLTSGVADVLKARGWGAHGIQRKGVPGFERDDITRVLYDYKSGLNGWLTKMEAAKDFSEALSGIDARRTPNLWKYTAQYVKDMLRNSDRVDRITGNIKSVAFAWYLGGSIKTAFVNATQNLVVGVPRLQMDVTGGGRLWLDGAQKAIIDRVTGSKGKGLSDEEAKLVHELYGESVITDAFMEEVRGHLQGFTGATLWNKFTKALGLPMSEVERFNRASLALAAFRAARSGKLKQQAKEKYGVRGEQANYDQAKEFATDVVRDAHFVYGKSNLPEFMRSNTAGRSMASLYTFRTFTHNMIAMWAWALESQGKEGAAFVAKSIGATMALGGVTALPFYATIMALCQAATGDDDDWTEKLRSWLPKNNLLRDVVCYGTPAMAGVNIGGSLKMETPITGGLAKGKTPKEILTQSIGDIIGVPYDLLIEKPSKMIEAHSKGNTWRMVEEAMPVAFKSGMQAWRLYTQGQTTMSGRPINDPGTRGARKLSSSEAIGKALGFQPVSSTKSYDAYAAAQHSKQVRDDKLDDLTALALKTFDTGDPAGRKEMLKDLKDWNSRMKEEGKPNMLIAPKEVIRRVKARRRENRPTPKNLREKARLQASWN